MPTTREPWQPWIIPKLIAAGCERASAEGITASVESQEAITREDGRCLYGALGESETSKEHTDAES